MNAVFVSAEQLAEALGVKPSWVKRQYRLGKIPGERFSPRVIRFDLNLVLALYRNQRQKNITTQVNPGVRRKLWE